MVGVQCFLRVCAGPEQSDFPQEKVAEEYKDKVGLSNALKLDSLLIMPVNSVGVV